MSASVTYIALQIVQHNISCLVCGKDVSLLVLICWHISPIKNEKKNRMLGLLNLFFLLCFQGCIYSKYPEPSRKSIQSNVEDVLYLRARIQNIECIKKLLDHLIDLGGLFNIAHY